jgi:hypothetical protein
MKLPKTTLPPGEAPTTLGGKILASTPVIMTVVATLLAGLANSEMTRAQYDRSMAAQLQSKVGDQWSFFQAKKLRGATLRASLESLYATSDAGPVQTADLKRFFDVPESALTALTRGELPAQPEPVRPPEKILHALTLSEEGGPEVELVKALRELRPTEVDAAIQVWQEASRAQDASLAPINSAIDKTERALQLAAGEKRDGARQTLRDFTAARFRVDAARYDSEARFNRAIASLSELKVRLSNLSAERHQKRSQRFFFGMLAAQLAVILATLGMAVKRRNLMWSFAAGIGLLAVSFGVYVYLWL